MCRLPPGLLYNRSRAEQEGVFYPGWSLICAGKMISNPASSLNIQTKHSVGKARPSRPHSGRAPTHRERVIQFEAAEHLVGVPGMEESVTSHHHLETLWETAEVLLGICLFSN